MAGRQEGKGRPQHNALVHREPRERYVESLKTRTVQSVLTMYNRRRDEANEKGIKLSVVRETVRSKKTKWGKEKG